MKNQYYNYFIFLIIVFLIYYFILSEYITLINSNYFKHNYIEYPNFLSTQKCKQINNSINNIDIKDNPLNEYFNNSKGFVLKFNSKNAYKTLNNNKDTDFLYNIYKQLKKSYANNFIMNILIIDSTNNINEQSIEYHYDMTIDIEYKFLGINFDHVPECVSVLYINTPQNFNGGELKLFKYNYFNVGNIKPQIGKLVEFNGKLLHGVNNIQNLDNNNNKRISIVLEQYCIR